MSTNVKLIHALQNCPKQGKAGKAWVADLRQQKSTSSAQGQPAWGNPHRADPSPDLGPLKRGLWKCWRNFPFSQCSTVSSPSHHLGTHKAFCSYWETAPHRLGTAITLSCPNVSQALLFLLPSWLWPRWKLHHLLAIPEHQYSNCLTSGSPPSTALPPSCQQWENFPQITAHASQKPTVTQHPCSAWKLVAWSTRPSASLLQHTGTMQSRAGPRFAADTSPKLHFLTGIHLLHIPPTHNHWPRNEGFPLPFNSNISFKKGSPK